MFMLMPLGGLGMPELLIVLVIVVLLFGGSKLKGVGRGLGEAISEFKKGMREGENTPPGGNDPGKPPANSGS
jgi:sec-independent protein translocase protein TatA